ncbi:unnamed protein product [Paramecium primaurelia]|uniref:H-type lectin domain-containing protein n=1 Tax=Paramecium primaurelia TaxID=5886 RepID=A0A8S1PNV1_PARPR|nr:unnamed protein product [Paramecium primaurelia]
MFVQQIIIVVALISKIQMVTFLRDYGYPINENNTISCTQSKQLNYKFTFQEFDRIPQVILNIWQLNMTQDENEVQTSISQVQKQSFILNIGCPKSGIVKQLRLKWFAIDDQRIQVINCYNMTEIKRKTFLHNNPNALSGYVSITSIGFKGKVNFYLKILDLNTTSVTIDILGNYENVTQLGYQVILGINGFFQQLNDNSFFQNFTSENLNYIVRSNQTLANCFYGFDYYNSGNFDFLNSMQESSTKKSFNYSIQPNGGGSYNSIFFIMIKIQTTFLPLQFQKLSIKLVKAIPQQYQAKIIISNQENDQIFQSIGEFQLIVDKSFDKVNLFTLLRCNTNSTIQSSFNKFQKSIILKQLNLTHQCDSNLNQINFQLVLNNMDETHQELKITISEFSCSVSQILYNQVKEELKLYEIYIQN